MSRKLTVTVKPNKTETKITMVMESDDGKKISAEEFFDALQDFVESYGGTSPS